MIGPVHTLSPTALDCLQRAAESLQEAMVASDTGTRYASAHVSALRSASAIIAVRAHRSRRRELNAWLLLRRVAPELEEWADLFAAGARKRAAVEAGGHRVISEREADDLVREADRFLAVVERSLGLLPHVPWERQVPWRASAGA